tara:strand:+ start:292 stop:564 length:273 start_codon:yes stop_codon:yes gene_type:complete
MKTTHTIAEIRATINTLLNVCEKEFHLEHEVSDIPAREYDDSRNLGVLTFTLATICFNNPEALKRLEKRVTDITRQVHILNASKKRRSKA